MSTEQPEFRPVEMAPKRPVWPFAVMGAAIVALAVLLVRREAAPAMKPATLANVTAGPDVKALADAVAPQLQAAKAGLQRAIEPAAAAPARSQGAAPAPVAGPASPNVIGGERDKAAREARLVPASEIERERARTRGAQKQATTYRKQVVQLEKRLASTQGELAQARNALYAVQHPRQPPPTDQEQILQTLAPVLATGMDSRQ